MRQGNAVTRECRAESPTGTRITRIEYSSMERPDPSFGSVEASAVLEETADGNSTRNTSRKDRPRRKRAEGAAM
jgi:hypothetical protein